MSVSLKRSEMSCWLTMFQLVFCLFLWSSKIMAASLKVVVNEEKVNFKNHIVSVWWIGLAGMAVFLVAITFCCVDCNKRNRNRDEDNGTSQEMTRMEPQNADDKNNGDETTTQHGDDDDRMKSIIAEHNSEYSILNTAVMYSSTEAIEGDCCCSGLTKNPRQCKVAVIRVHEAAQKDIDQLSPQLVHAEKLDKTHQQAATPKTDSPPSSSSFSSHVNKQPIGSKKQDSIQSSLVHWRKDESIIEHSQSKKTRLSKSSDDVSDEQATNKAGNSVGSRDGKAEESNIRSPLRIQGSSPDNDVINGVSNFTNMGAFEIDKLPSLERRQSNIQCLDVGDDDDADEDADEDNDDDEEKDEKGFCNVTETNDDQRVLLGLSHLIPENIHAKEFDYTTDDRIASKMRMEHLRAYFSQSNAISILRDHIKQLSTMKPSIKHVPTKQPSIKTTVIKHRVSDMRTWRSSIYIDRNNPVTNCSTESETESNHPLKSTSVVMYIDNRDSRREDYVKRSISVIRKNQGNTQNNFGNSEIGYQFRVDDIYVDGDFETLRCDRDDEIIVLDISSLKSTDDTKSKVEDSQIESCTSFVTAESSVHKDDDKSPECFVSRRTEQEISVSVHEDDKLFLPWVAVDIDDDIDLCYQQNIDDADIDACTTQLYAQKIGGINQEYSCVSIGSVDYSVIVDNLHCDGNDIQGHDDDVLGDDQIYKNMAHSAIFNLENSQENVKSLTNSSSMEFNKLITITDDSHVKENQPPPPPPSPVSSSSSALRYSNIAMHLAEFFRKFSRNKSDNSKLTGSSTSPLLSTSDLIESSEEDRVKGHHRNGLIKSTHGVISENWRDRVMRNMESRDMSNVGNECNIVNISEVQNISIIDHDGGNSDLKTSAPHMTSKRNIRSVTSHPSVATSTPIIANEILSSAHQTSLDMNEAFIQYSQISIDNTSAINTTEKCNSQIEVVSTEVQSSKFDSSQKIISISELSPNKLTQLPLNLETQQNCACGSSLLPDPDLKHLTFNLRKYLPWQPSRPRRESKAEALMKDRTPLKRRPRSAHNVPSTDTAHEITVERCEKAPLFSSGRCTPFDLRRTIRGGKVERCQSFPLEF